MQSTAGLVPRSSLTVARPSGARIHSRPTAVTVLAFKDMQSSTERPTWASTGELRDSFIKDNAWTGHLLELTDTIHEQLQQLLEPLSIQPTKYAPDGVVYVQSQDGKTCEFKVETYSGTSSIKHKFLSSGVFAGPGVLNIKLGVQAATYQQGTPFLELGMVGSPDSVLVELVFTPRLSTLMHAEYITKYYRNTPASYAALMSSRQPPFKLPVPTKPPSQLATYEGRPLASFREIHQRMSKQAERSKAMGVTETARASRAAQEAGAANPDDDLLYRHYHISQVWSRVLAGHACSFSLDHRNPEALQALTKDMKEFVALWCAWVAADATAPPLDEPLLSECKQLSALMAHHLHPEHDDTADFARKLMGDEAIQVLADTMGGVAVDALNMPWWAK